MKLLGFFLLLSGWGIVVAAIALLAPTAPALVLFVLAGTGVELLGLLLVVRSHAVLEGQA
jgi:hypothetical protein